MALVDTSIVIRKPDPDEHERRVTKLVESMRSGAPLSTACAYAGVSRTTLNRWMEEGLALRDIRDHVQQDPEDDREPSASEMELIWLAEAIEQADAEAEVNAMTVVQDAAEIDWRAAAWMLERRWRTRWASKVEIDTGSSGKVDTKQVAGDVLDEIAARLAAQEQVVAGGGRPEIEAEVIRDGDTADD